MGIKDIAEEMTKTPDRYARGFMRTLNFYIGKHNLAIPLIKVKQGILVFRFGIKCIDLYDRFKSKCIDLIIC